MATAIPETFYAGGTIDWEFTLANNSPGDGWAAQMVLTPTFTGGTPITLAAGTSGNTFTLEETAANTASYDPGLYSWVIKATKGAVVEMPASGELRIHEALGTVSAEITRLQTDLAACDAALRAAVTDKEGVLKYAVQTNAGEREVEFRTLAELQQHRAWLLRELDRAKGEAGMVRKSGWRQIKSKMVS